MAKRFGASEGAIGLAAEWSSRTFTKEELEGYGLEVVEEPERLTRAEFSICDFDMNLREMPAGEENG